MLDWMELGGAMFPVRYLTWKAGNFGDEEKTLRITIDG